MSTAKIPEIVICTYRVQADRLDDFLEVLKEHWPTLRTLGLATETPARVYQGQDAEGPVITEIFTWVDGKAPETAHETPEVMKIWEPLGSMCESRGGRPSMEFPHVVELPFHGTH